MNSTFDKSALPATPEWVPETAFGKWFLSTNIWFRFVLTQAVTDLRRLAGAEAEGRERLLDIGCGQGQSFSLLRDHFRPRAIVGVDIDPRQVERARHAAQACGGEVSVRAGSVTRLDLPDASIDVVFCHQLIHHVAHQDGALRELKRVLKPGGLLLISESCEPFIRIWTVRWFFRHPPGVQKSAQGFVDLVRGAGFELPGHRIETSTPYWSLPDLGILRRFGLQRKKLEPTEVLIVARKPG